MRLTRMRQFSVLVASAAILLPASGIAASGSLTQSQFLPSFDVDPASISIQKFDAKPELGNTLVMVTLDKEERARLGKETGRTDFLLLGPNERPVVLRDDGAFPDLVKGDSVFTTLALLGKRELDGRTQNDASATSRSAGTNLEFSSRGLEGTRSVEAFDSGSFEAGNAVTLGPPVVSLGSSTPGFTTAFQDNVLMITHPNVVGDPTRTIDPCSPPPPSLGPLPAWSFGRLMSDMANQPLTGIDPRVFVEDWLDHWLANQTINTFNVAQRLAMQNIIDDWRNASGTKLLDLRLSPFELIAIVPRIDLRQTTTGGGGYGGSSGTNFLNAGEGRFVFALRDAFSPGCGETPFTVILEYGVPLDSCKAVRGWAQDWSALDTMVIGSPLYNSALQSLTDVFAAAGADPSKPNDSAINQVRTNENELNPLWELREFRLLSKTASMLSQTTVAETPDQGFAPSNSINTFIGAGSPSPMPLNHPVSGIPFLGGAAETPFPPSGFFWDGVPSMPGPTSGRHGLSLNTCNGCHGGETDTFFVHINPAPTGVLSFLPLLSDFLVGANVTDPVDGTVRFFDDLDRRETDIGSVAGMSCFSIVASSPHHLLEFVERNGVLPDDVLDGDTLSSGRVNDLSFDHLHTQNSVVTH